MVLRVLLTHERFPPDFAGGGEYVVLRTAAALQARGCAVQVVTTGDPAIRMHDGIATARLPVSRYALNLQAGRIAAFAAEADIIQTFNYHAALPSLLAGRRTGRPVVCCILALFGAAWRAMRGRLVGRAFTALERFVVSRRYDRTVFLSKASRQAGLLLGADPARSLVIAPGIDHARFRDTGQATPLVAVAGRLDARKGVQHVIAAARALPALRFRIVGWGEGVAQIRSAALGNVELIEEHAGPAYADTLAAATIFFSPSYAETFGVAALEAMASGCAVVASLDTLAFDGAMVAPGDEAAMIAALAALSGDPARVRAAGAANRRRAAGFTWQAHADRLLETYAEVGVGPRVVRDAA